jgi:hypothetical protein
VDEGIEKILVHPDVDTVLVVFAQSVKEASYRKVNDVNDGLMHGRHRSSVIPDEEVGAVT